MTITAFTQSLELAAAQNDAVTLARLINYASSKEWKEAGFDVSPVIEHILSSTIDAANQATLVKNIVSSGTILGSTLGLAINSFISTGNFQGAYSVLNMASSAELKSVATADYGTALKTLTDSAVPDDMQVTMTKMVVSYGTVPADVLGYALKEFITQGNLPAAQYTITMADSAEYKSILPQDYGTALTILLNGAFSDTDKAAYARLLIDYGTVPGADLGNALNQFITQGNLNGALTVLNAASSSELTTVTSLDFGKALKAITNETFADTDQTALAKALIDKGVLSGADLAYALKEFIAQGNILGAWSVLNIANKEELKSISTTDYSAVLKAVTNTNILDADQLSLTKSLVEKGVVGGEALGFAINEFIAQNNTQAAYAILNLASTDEIKSISWQDYSKALVTLSALAAPDSYQTALKAYVLDGLSDLSAANLGSALKDLVTKGNLAAATEFLNKVDSSALKLITAADYSAALKSLTNTAFLDADQTNLTRLLVSGAEITAATLNNALSEFASQKNFLAIDAAFGAMSAAEKALVTLTTINTLDSKGYHSTAETINGGYDADILIGFGGNDKLYGGYGDDKLYGGSGNDTLEGGAGNDLLYGGAGNDTLRGQEQNDKLYGEDGDDKLYGDAGADTLDGGAGNDTLYGGDDNDVLYGQAGNDKLYGDAGNDKLYGGDGTDTLYGGAGNDLLYGDAGNDTLYGGEGNDKLYGGAGNDIFYGNQGNDYMYGEAGNDIFYAQVVKEGVGKDFINGGAGKDTIIFDIKFKDAIIDFEDKIDVDLLVKGKNGTVTSIKDVEVLQFADKTYTVDQLHNMINHSKTDNIIM